MTAYGARADLRTCAVLAAQKRTPVPTGEGGERSWDPVPKADLSHARASYLFQTAPSLHVIV